MANQRSNTFISKKMSYCLRHNPKKYGLELDEYGFVDLQYFLNAMNRMRHFQPKLTEMKIREITQSSDKKRFEIKNGKICTLYGHSLPGIIKEEKPFHLKFCIMVLLTGFYQVLKTKDYYQWADNTFICLQIFQWQNQ